MLRADSKNPLQYPQSIALKGKLEGLYRRRVGDWRIIYEVDTNQRIVYILQIVHRGKAYR
ncbi:MAG: type II toxin-antitoxin system RelE/ParE family toxin [Caldilineae bacterium]|nr:MAG: type II toxin-antitoxin system RelE/ParE family toxin [Caldilineae bacterium]